MTGNERNPRFYWVCATCELEQNNWSTGAMLQCSSCSTSIVEQTGAEQLQEEKFLGTLRTAQPCRPTNPLRARCLRTMDRGTPTSTMRAILRPLRGARRISDPRHRPLLRARQSCCLRLWRARRVHRLRLHRPEASRWRYRLPTPDTRCRPRASNFIDPTKHQVSNVLHHDLSATQPRHHPL